VLSLVFISIGNPSLGNPSNWSFKISDSIRFDFKGCSADNIGVVCTGNFRSLNGEQTLANIGPGSSVGGSPITITDSQGKVYVPDKVTINNNWSCSIGSSDCPGGSLISPGVGSLLLVEGVNYKASFIFREISLPSPKISLFRLSSVWYGTDIKVRNIKVLDSNTSSQQRYNIAVKPKLINSPKQNVNLSYRIGDSIKFDFQGCSRANNSDVVCIANFRSLNGDREIVVGPRMSDRNRTGASLGVTITNSEGQSYLASKVNINNNWSCGVDSPSCPGGYSYIPGEGRIVLVEGVNYKTTFIFRDVALPSPKLSLFSLSSINEIKIRNIKISE
jgi:hypothetical protein